MILAAAALCCTTAHTPATADHPSSISDSISVYAHIRRQLDSIGIEDQRFRDQLEYLSANHDTLRLKAVMDSMAYGDSRNIRIVSHILDTYGWLGPDRIGPDANSTLFMVVQHSDLSYQQKYLPLMRAAVAAGKALNTSLALLEDRVAIREGRKQIYGSQLAWNMKENSYYVAPLEDPDNVDKRRAAMGLPTMAEYIGSCCNLVWDAAVYKKDMHGLKKMQ